jgi:short-subunit dehydrogenase
MESTRNKTVWVIGGTGTIGRKAAALLSNSGANVFITGRDPQKLVDAGNAGGIPEENRFVLDLEQISSIEPVIQSMLERSRTPDILINAAGIGIIKPVENLGIEDFQRTININLTASFVLMKYVIPAMKTNGKGLIIHIPGVLGKTPMAGAAAYAASKYGLNGMMKSIREELKRTNIRITQLFLGGVDSDFWNSIDLKVQRDKMIVSDEAAKAIWFLCQQPLSGVVSEMVIQPFNHQAI